MRHDTYMPPKGPKHQSIIRAALGGTAWARKPIGRSMWSPPIPWWYKRLSACAAAVCLLSVARSTNICTRPWMAPRCPVRVCRGVLSCLAVPNAGSASTRIWALKRKRSGARRRYTRQVPVRILYQVGSALAAAPHGVIWLVAPLALRRREVQQSFV